MILRFPRWLTLTFLALFVLVAVGGMWGLAHMEHHGAVPTCIFMPGEDVVCTMTALEHSVRWQVAFAGTLTTVLALLGVLLAGVYCGTAHAPPLGAWRVRTLEPDLLRHNVLIGGTVSPRAP